MAERSEGDSVPPGYQYFARVRSGRPEIGAYLPNYEGDLTVYWQGKVSRANIRTIVEEAEVALKPFAAGANLRGELDIYGIKTKQPSTEFERHVGPVANGLYAYLDPYTQNQPSAQALPDFEACRAELTVSQGLVVIWANVSGEKSGKLENGGENIGLSVPQQLFKGAARNIIKRAITSTKTLNERIVLQLLNDIASAVQKRELKNLAASD
ncbi:hypothetical protein IVB12_07940 [Bradyrhizobium sp. 179]|uniref:hypothetical protein n=1 Tax=Bradyrhizobium sp. 179 TaxID=2782648 RepID=UPI001FF91136|nr:hypothetical protein [Bradyrhizobium sp. 179]MCK1541904.1 hypothetical protein [Bradyrhizobium sp. 179]